MKLPHDLDGDITEKESVIFYKRNEQNSQEVVLTLDLELLSKLKLKLIELELYIHLCYDSECLVCRSKFSCSQCPESHFRQGKNCYRDSCPPGFWSDQTKMICRPCPENCEVCSDNNTCDRCNPGFEWNGASCIKKAGDRFLEKSNLRELALLCNYIDHCASCPNPSVCSQCSGGYYWDGTYCSPCQAGCLSCTDGSSCDGCGFGQYTNPETGECTYTCPFGTWPNAFSKTCEYCLDFCLECSTGSSCNECVLGYEWDGSACVFACPTGQFNNGGTCTNCISNCASCSDGTSCNVCKPGFFKTASNTCQACMSNCDTCTSDSVCTQCSNTYYWDGTSCTQTCGTGKWPKAVTRTCEPCISGCESCSTGTTCNSCQNGYFLTSSSTCQQCMANCNTCSSADTCSLCESSYYWDGTACSSTCPPRYWPNPATRTCDSCSSNCYSCSSATDCTTCDSGYFLTGSNTCQQCPAHCDVCSSSSTCTTCSSGYFWDGTACTTTLTCTGATWADTSANMCKPCLANCASCTSGTTCTLCTTSYFWDGSSCTSTCPTGTFPNSGNRSCDLCLDHCESCSSATSCSLCKPSYFWTGSACSDTCPSGTIPNAATRTCDVCMANCESCPVPGQCALCASNYYWNGVSCVTSCDIGKWKYRSTRTCEDTAPYSISGSSSVSSCDVLTLQVNIIPAEQAYISSVTWTVLSTSVNSAARTNLENFLQTQNSITLNIPASYLEPNVQYTFRLSDSINAGLSVSFVTKTDKDLSLTIEFNGGTSQTLRHFKDNLIRANAYSAHCIGAYQAVWSQVSGPALDPNSFVNPDYPLWLQIPKCTFAPNNVYQFKVSVNLLGVTQASYVSEMTITLNILPEQYSASVFYGDRDQFYTLPLSLRGALTLEGGCPSLDPTVVTYKWTCEKASSLYLDYEVCDDPDGLFGVTRTSPLLVVPTTYYTKDQAMRLTLTVTKGSTVVTRKTTIIFTDLESVTIELTCDGATCVKYSPSQTTEVEALIDGGADIAIQSYSWSLLPDFPKVSFQANMKILQNTMAYSRTTLIITVSASNSTHKGKTILELPINDSPQGGSITATPLTGQSLSTQFHIDASGWTDTDLPLSYQFYYKFQNLTTWRILTDIQMSNTLDTYLVGKAPDIVVELKAQVRDIYNAFAETQTSVTVNVGLTNIDDSLDTIFDLLNSLTAGNPSQNLNILSLAMTELSTWQSTLSSSPNSCPSCSNHGACINNKCKCNSEWTLNDCSLPKATLDRIIEAKVKAQELLSQHFEQAHTPEMTQFLLDAMEESSSNGQMINENTLNLMQKVLENLVDISDPAKILTPEESNSVAVILGNMMAYAGSNDCGCQTQFCDDLESKANDYIQKISQSTLSNIVPGEESIVISTDLYDIVTAKTTPCNLPNLILNTGANTPTTTMSFENPALADCSKQISVQYYVFKSHDQIFNCQGTSSSDPTKSEVMIKLTDGNGQPITSGVKVDVKMPPGTSCPNTCQRGTVRDTCECKLAAFDVKNQMARIFGKSEISNLADIDALQDWKFYASPIFWFDFTCTVWLGVTLYIVRKKLANYCALKKFKKQKVKSLSGTLAVGFLVRITLTYVNFRYQIPFSVSILYLWKIYPNLSEPLCTTQELCYTQLSVQYFLMPLQMILR